MQVNVKELTGILHLKLVFMNVLVLQSFLAVCQVSAHSLAVFFMLSVPSSSLPSIRSFIIKCDYNSFYMFLYV